MSPIDADKLKEQISVAINSMIEGDETEEELKLLGLIKATLDAAIALAPIVEAEPVTHGYWIPVDGGDSCNEWECSACGRVMTFTHEADYDDMREEFPRCPKCGSYMDVEEDTDG